MAKSFNKSLTNRKTEKKTDSYSEKRTGGNRKRITRKSDSDEKSDNNDDKRGGNRSYPKKTYEKRENNDRKPFIKRKSSDRDESSDRPKKRYDRTERSNREESSDRPKKRYDRTERSDKESTKSDRFKKRFNSREDNNKDSDRKSYAKKTYDGKKVVRKRTDDDDSEKGGYKKREYRKGQKSNYKFEKEKLKGSEHTKTEKSADGMIRLNKYISNSGICSRREADEYIKAGLVKVNGVIVTEMGIKVNPTDKVTFSDHTVQNEKKVYILLNKPRNYITTVDDPQGRSTVMEIIKDACHERVYPVGRLDARTMGVLLLTNDGEITTKLTHPKNNVRKIYEVELDKNLKDDDFEKILEGIELEDGHIAADQLEFPYQSTRKVVGLEIHSGRNRIVRRIFEHLGYKIKKLDRVYFAGLTKKNLRRGHWRFLTKEELNHLLMLPSK